MSLYMDSSMRDSLREVLAWERQNPAIVARDSAAASKRAATARESLIKNVTTPITHTPRRRGTRPAGPYTKHCGQCAEAFVSSSFHSVYCSDKCRWHAADERKANRRREEATK